MLTPYRMDQVGRVFQESNRFKEFEDRCRTYGLRYFAINVAQKIDKDMSSYFEDQEDRDEDKSFSYYIPMKERFEEILLFENHCWAYGPGQAMKIAISASCNSVMYWKGKIRDWTMHETCLKVLRWTKSRVTISRSNVRHGSGLAKSLLLRPRRPQRRVSSLTPKLC
jgi:hypothetical protein